MLISIHLVDNALWYEGIDGEEIKTTTTTTCTYTSPGFGLLANS